MDELRDGIGFDAKDRRDGSPVAGMGAPASDTTGTLDLPDRLFRDSGFGRQFRLAQMTRFPPDAERLCIVRHTTAPILAAS